jgi:phosphopantothenoylcysteine synthetase/decarboxylase
VSSTKIKKGDASARIELVRNPDLLGEIGAAREATAGAVDVAPAAATEPGARLSNSARRPVLVGFAVETAGGHGEALTAYARRKLEDKRVDMVVCNEASESFGHDDSRIGFVTNRSDAPTEFLPRASKSALADAILERVRTWL